ncbi:MAG: RNA polymerase sigma factor [bacterium]|nr:RNA polymerase sigma factor [bacterium]
MLFNRNKTEHSVENLVAAAQNGRTEAFGKLYDNFVDQIYRFTYFKVGDRKTAEDLTQTIFLKAFEKLGTFKKKSSFVSWLFAIARNLIIDHYRNKDRLTESTLFEDFEGLDHTEDFENKDLLKATLVEINKLPEEERQVLVLSNIEDYSFKEIGKILGRSEGSLRILKFRALKKLKKALNL